MSHLLSQSPAWEKTKITPGHRWPVADSVVWSTPTQGGPGRIIVGKSASTQQWHIGGWWPGHEPKIADFPGNAFSSAAKAKAYVNGLAKVERSQPRAANRDVGDVVLAAEQYFAAQEDELDLMKRGTPEELRAARKQTKKAKEVLEKMTGANRELWGSVGGGTVGAGLAALTGNPILAAVGALAGSVAGSIVARPSLTPEAPPERARPRREGREGGGQLIPFRRPAARGYAANRGRPKAR